MENIMNENSVCPSERVNVILKALTNPKYIKEDTSDSEDEYESVLVKHRLKKF
jgi:hypothetical protein